jgi:hypothetical protein
MKLRRIATALAANLVAITAALALDADLPAYWAVRGISGQIKSVESDEFIYAIYLYAPFLYAPFMSRENNTH